MGYLLRHVHFIQSQYAPRCCIELGVEFSLVTYLSEWVHSLTDGYLQHHGPLANRMQIVVSVAS
jgi:hypothetical protein